VFGCVNKQSYIISNWEFPKKQIPHHRPCYYKNTRNDETMICVVWVILFLVGEDYSLLGSDAVLIGNLVPTFRRSLPPS
jgi:hypothetical protein